MQTYSNELLIHHTFFKTIVNKSDKELKEDIELYEKIENSIESFYKEAESKLNDSERESGGGFAYYGVGDKIWSFPNILNNHNIDIS